MTKKPKTDGRTASPTRDEKQKRPSARERIFKTAGALFYLKGIRAVGVETIAAEADTIKMSLYPW
jgi:AcrR family transcriptional regulator